ncbi:MAG: XrtA/PEP-CTERM system TPR-repeat protein PrsT [Pseudomonadota bacterium]
MTPHPAPSRGRLGRSALALVLALVLAGCGRSTSDRLDQVRTLIERQDRAAAMVSVKDLLQDQPDLGEARLLLGQLLLDRGEAAAAETELRRALELRQPEVVVVPVLARALLLGNQPAKLVAQFGRTSFPDRLASVQLKTTVAEAEAMLGQLDAARDSLDRALRAMPGHEPALLLRARVTAVGGDLGAAMAQVNALLASNPKNADAWVLQGDLLARQRAEPAALAKAYQQALAVRPDHAMAHTALVTLHLTLRDLDAARSQHEAMRKLLPRHPQTLLFDGQMALIKGDLAKARELFQLLLRGMPDNLVLLQSAGVVELRLNAPGQAEVLLSKAVQLAPNSPNARRLAAQAYLALGQPARALAVLEPITGPKAPDAEALTLAAQARLMAGDAALAASLFERAAKLQPDDPKIRTALALSHLQRGQGESALAELQRVAASDSTGTSADLALIAALLQRRSFDPALQAIAALAKKQPDQALPAHLRGQVLLHKRDTAGARAAFEQALRLDAGYFPSVTALAGLDLVDKRPEVARARFEALLKANPRNGPATIALAELAMRTGAGRGAVAAQLEAGIQASPDDATLRLALVGHHLETGNPKAALAAAQAALVQMPDHFELLGRLGQAQLLTGDGQQALNTFNRMVALQGKSPAGHMGLAEAQLAANDPAGAGRSLKRALELEPDHLPAQRLQVMLALRQKQPEQALAVARQVQQQRPAVAAGYLLEGEVQIVQQRWVQAVAALRQAVTKADPQQSAARLHHALLKSGQPAEAEAMAAAWTKDHPRDLLFLFHLGDEALARQDFATAEARYRAVLAVSPEHALSLNNVAWLMLTQKKPGALPYAERAVKASPDRPALRDTLAQALAAENQLPQALEMQKSALALRPDDPYLRLNLAKLHVQANQKKLAKTELDRLALLGDRFARQDEVAQLLKQLGGR